MYCPRHDLHWEAASTVSMCPQCNGEPDLDALRAENARLRGEVERAGLDVLGLRGLLAATKKEHEESSANGTEWIGKLLAEVDSLTADLARVSGELNGLLAAAKRVVNLADEVDEFGELGPSSMNDLRAAIAACAPLKEQPLTGAAVEPRRGV
jgi:hypothetical protein